MPNTREKLIELLICADDYEVSVCRDYPCKVCRYKGVDCTYKSRADYLIANGVTIATDNNKWIPVTERLPEDNERVLVYHDDGMIRFGINKGGFADVASLLYLEHYHRTCFSKVTHWMPLPTPPKGEEQ